MDISKVVLIWALPVLTILAIIIRTVYIKKHCPSSKDTTSNLQLTVTDPCSSSSSSSQPSSWDVFLSFYGKDTRRNFTSHLYSALDQAGIRTFRDDPALEKGQEISSSLSDAIRNSNMFIVVLSENYARSPWCLNELAEILSCDRTKNQVIPVFCYVDPSDVRHQKGSFGKALDYHKKRYTVDLIDKWKSALEEISKLSGYHLEKNANEKESNTVQEIVEKVTSVLSTKLIDVDGYLVGTGSSVEQIYQKLRMESNSVRAIGICGMGGIGKTTTAKVFYNKYFKNFDISCFIDDVKQLLKGHRPLLALLQQLLNELIGRNEYKVSDVNSGLRQLQQILSNRKALIVLDDLDLQPSYSEFLLRLCNLFSAGSRIIFTTRDANLANQLKGDNISGVDIYMMRELDQVHSLKLFSYHAFQQPTPPENFKELSVSFIAYAGGLPLALKVLGSFLSGRTDVSFWKGNLEKVKNFGENRIQQILRLSYDELGDDTVKDIFLDIAFFFVGRDKDEAVHIFQSCDFFPEVGIPVLVERCLLTISQDNIFQMHSLIQDMGKKVIREESKGGNCRRLYMCGVNACMALQNLECQGSACNIEGLIIKQTMSTKRYFNAKIFERLPKLRLLEIIGALDIEGNFDNSFYELRCFRWHHCPWIRLPSSFCPPNLVSLDMPFSEFKTLWNGTKLNQPLVNLKTINVSHSRNLKIMPDFTYLQSVEKLVFRDCESLVEVHPSIGRLTNLSHLDLGKCNHLEELTEQIGQLTKLGHLDLGECVNLKRLPEAIIQLTTLSSLKLRDCHNLTRLPEQLGDMKCLKMLDASWTSIEQLPDSIGYLKELVELKLYKCKKLRKLPEQIGNMESLKLFNASFSAIEHLPDSIGYLKELVELHLYRCNKLRNLPEQIGNLESLKLFTASFSAIEHLPDTFGGLINLEELYLSFCQNLTSLPNSLWKLKVLRVLNLEWSSNLEQLPEQLGKMQCLERLSASGTAVEELPDSIGLLSTLQVLDLKWCKKVRNIPSSIWNLTSLAQLSVRQEDMVKIDLPDMVKDMKLKSLGMTCDVSLWLPVILSLSTLEKLYLDCESQSFSPNEPYSLSKLSNLRHLTLSNWTTHECSFPELPLNLTKLKIYYYETLEMLPDLSSLKQLKILSLWRCISLQSIPPLPPHLEKLDLHECTSLQSIPPLPPHLKELSLNECTCLQDLSDLSILKELRSLELKYCINLKSNSLKQSFLQVGQHNLNSFEAYIPNKEVAEWFSYKSSGNTLSFTIPPNSNSGDNFFGFGLWIVYKGYQNGISHFNGRLPHLRGVITNRTKDITMMGLILFGGYTEVVGEVQSRVQVVGEYLIENLSMESGDRIEVFIPSLLYSDLECQVPTGEVMVKNCGAHLISRKHCYC